MSKVRTSKTGRTTAVAIFRRDAAILKALAALAGHLPADVVRGALAAWLEGQPEDVRSVVRAVEARLARESGS